ncbi:hypothetical protein [Mariniluteicoccus endophyticus]
MTDPILEAVAEGERRALREWQQEHPEPCGDCEWTITLIKDWSGGLVVESRKLFPCARHGGPA